MDELNKFVMLATVTAEAAMLPPWSIQQALGKTPKIIDCEEQEIRDKETRGDLPG